MITLRIRRERLNLMFKQAVRVGCTAVGADLCKNLSDLILVVCVGPLIWLLFTLVVDLCNDRMIRLST